MSELGLEIDRSRQVTRAELDEAGVAAYRMCASPGSRQTALEAL